nr:MAG TPA: hypothetical protein [Caudoviricetes sp.]
MISPAQIRARARRSSALPAALRASAARGRPAFLLPDLPPRQAARPLRTTRKFPRGSLRVPGIVAGSRGIVGKQSAIVACRLRSLYIIIM